MAQDAGPDLDKYKAYLIHFPLMLCKRLHSHVAILAAHCNQHLYMTQNCQVQLSLAAFDCTIHSLHEAAWGGTACQILCT